MALSDGRHIYLERDGFDNGSSEESGWVEELKDRERKGRVLRWSFIFVGKERKRWDLTSKSFVLIQKTSQDFEVKNKDYKHKLKEHTSAIWRYGYKATMLTAELWRTLQRTPERKRLTTPLANYFPIPSLTLHKSIQAALVFFEGFLDCDGYRLPYLKVPPWRVTVWVHVW